MPTNVFYKGKPIEQLNLATGTTVTLPGVASLPQAVQIAADASVTIGAGGLILPTSDPHIAGAWWDSAGTLTRSSG